MYVNSYNLIKIADKIADKKDNKTPLRDQFIQELADFCQVDTSTFLLREDAEDMIARGINLID